MNKTDKIYIAGHRGLVGSAVTRTLEKQPAGWVNGFIVCPTTIDKFTMLG